eukprot:gnl/MRDRNA2_/MRDRNA2_52524_c0_seq1.p1 gnl/MRDRNA2_/MRDRNA2_52524_c0~~gnl/MRDRNA2_/MRDRNA2_52524_c0_seq1.p1  ORF type:complete len:170 (+),score=20.58 gnl/MRDRNA2_/MRDRNA2_52524_c0_seq1:49-510(+)
MTLLIKTHYAQDHSGRQWVEPRHGGWFATPSPPMVVGSKYNRSDTTFSVSVNSAATLETLMEASGYNKWRGSMEKWQAWVEKNGFVYTEGSGVKQCCMGNCVVKFGNNDLAEFVYNGKVLVRGSTLTDFGVHDGSEIHMYYAGDFTDQCINEH